MLIVCYSILSVSYKRSYQVTENIGVVDVLIHMKVHKQQAGAYDPF